MIKYLIYFAQPLVSGCESCCYSIYICKWNGPRFVRTLALHRPSVFDYARLNLFRKVWSHVTTNGEVAFRCSESPDSFFLFSIRELYFFYADSIASKPNKLGRFDRLLLYCKFLSLLVMIFMTVNQNGAGATHWVGQVVILRQTKNSKRSRHSIQLLLT